MSSNSKEYVLGPCPHPDCDVPIRLRYRVRPQRLTFYHGEDAVTDLTTTDGGAITFDLTPGSDMHTAISLIGWELGRLHAVGAFAGGSHE